MTRLVFNTLISSYSEGYDYRHCGTIMTLHALLRQGW
jgi:hypothetical protein